MKDLRLVQKLNRRMKLVKKNARGYQEYDKVNKLEEVMADSPGAYKLAIKVQRRLDASMGEDMVGQKPNLAFRLNASTVERHDYGVGDFGIRLTLASGLISSVRIRPGDVVEMLEGQLKGHMLKVVAVTDSTHLRCEDSSLGKPEITSIGCVADSSSSLNNKYFSLNNANNAIAYYVWYNVGGAGVDPAPGGTGIEVDISANATASAVATATALAIGAVSASFSASSSNQYVRVTNAADGASTDAADSGATGFSFTVLQQGSNDSMTTESNKKVRFELSTVKKSYV